MTHALESYMRPLCGLITQQLGIDTPEAQWPDLYRKLERLAQEKKWRALPEGLAWMVAHFDAPAVRDAVCSAITVGETYFFRELEGLERVVAHVLELLPGRQSRQQRVRLWCAGCSSGEEPYTLAAMLHERAPLLSHVVEIHATDLSPAALQRARAGLYSEWSFRTAPSHFIQRYFLKRGTRQYELGSDAGHPGASLRKLVRFTRLNLAACAFPPPQLGGAMFDAILCRNVLMYLEPEIARNCVAGFEASLLPDGLLVLGATEHFPLTRPKVAATAAPVPMAAPVWQEPHNPPSIFHNVPPPDPATEAAPAAAGALELCLSAAKERATDPDAHYLLGCMLRERGERAEAIAALRRTVYLNPEHAAAHVALGGLFREEGAQKLSQRHWQTAAMILGKLDPEQIISELGNMTAARLTEIARAAAERRQRT